MVLNPNSKLLVWPLSRSLAATWEIAFAFFSYRYLDVSVPCVALCVTTLLITLCLSITSGGFPHSDICGSMDICSSPQLFAACHVLRRLPVPRHPPCALLCLAFEIFGSQCMPYMALMHGLFFIVKEHFLVLCASAFLG